MMKLFQIEFIQKLHQRARQSHHQTLVQRHQVVQFPTAQMFQVQNI